MTTTGFSVSIPSNSKNPRLYDITKSEERRSHSELFLFEVTGLSCTIDMVKRIYVRTKKEPPKQKMNQEPKAMLRFLRIRGGIVALSPFQNCTPAKAIASTPKITKSVTILPIRGQSTRTMIVKRLENGQSHRCPSCISTLPIVTRVRDK